jgi:hypothetical protein
VLKSDLSERDDWSAFVLAPKDLLWGTKINNLALHRFELAKFNHGHFLSGPAQERT